MTAQTLTFLPSTVANLVTLRLELDLEAPVAAPAGSTVAVDYRMDGFGDRLGWREIIVRPLGDTAILQSSAPAVDQSKELRQYPALDPLASPLDVRAASLQYRPGTATTSPVGAGTTGSITAAPPADPLAALLGGVNGEITPLFALLAVLVSMGLGAIHAVSPGHGKTLVAAYLVGSRGNPRQAIWLGITVAVTHTAGVFILGVVTLAAAAALAPERILNLLSVASGIVVVLLGLSLVRAYLRDGGEAHGHSHDHEGGHVHDHGIEAAHDDALVHGHAHAADGSHIHAPARTTLTTRRAIALGLAGGLVPSVSALFVFLIALSQHQLLFGILLIVSFGAGMAAILGGVGVLIVAVKGSARQIPAGLRGRAQLQRIGRLLPLASGLMVLIAGTIVTVQAVLKLT